MCSAVVGYWVVECTWPSIYRAVLNGLDRFLDLIKTNLRATVFWTFWQFVLLIGYFELHSQLNQSTTVVCLQGLSSRITFENKITVQFLLACFLLIFLVNGRYYQLKLRWTLKNDTLPWTLGPSSLGCLTGTIGTK